MVSIIEVKTKKQLRCFVDYPNQLYRDVEQFVPATYGDDLEDWDPQQEPGLCLLRRALLAGLSRRRGCRAHRRHSQPQG